MHALYLIWKFLDARWGVVSVLIAIFTLWGQIMLGAFEKVQTLLTQLDELSAPIISFSGVAASPFALMNYLLPLDLGLTLFTSWLAFWLACVAIRIVKAWVPTVS